MPSAIRRLFNFSNKKKGHHGSKFQEYHGYDNQRFPTYPTLTQNLAHPQHHNQQQQSHVQHGHSYQTGQYQQAHPPPHSFSHRQQHQSQFQYQQQHQQQLPQNSMVQSTQLIATPAGPGNPVAVNPCQCQQCIIPNHIAYSHQSQANIVQQLTNPPQTAVAPPVATPHMQMLNSQLPLQPATMPAQPTVLNHLIPTHHQLQNQQQQVPSMQHDYQILNQQQQQQCMQGAQPQQLQQINPPCQEVTHRYANQMPEYVPQAAQCTCHHCPNHSQRILPPQNQLFHQGHIPNANLSEPLQQFIQPAVNPQQISTQQLDLAQPGSVCQHQMETMQMSNNQIMQQPCSAQYNNIPKNQLCTAHDQDVNASMMMSSSTPRIQHQDHLQPHQPSPHQQQYTNNNTTTNMSQFHYHTIQTNLYQQQKQQQQQQQHHRIQSMHQQQIQTQSPHQSNENQISHVIQSTSPSRAQVEPHLHEFSRYANVRSIIDESLQPQSSKYQEHVYCNQKPELILPPYQSPPSYEMFVENRKSYIIGMNSQHMTHHSESLASQKTKDSSYENLRRFSPYSNLGDKREPRLASQVWDDNCSSLLATEMKEDNSRTTTSLVY